MKKFLKIFILAICLILPTMFYLTACDSSLPSNPSKHTHDYSEIGYDSVLHWYYCKEDNFRKDGSEENHFDYNGDNYCDVCNFDMSTIHTHDYSVYDADSSNHWKVCSVCGAKNPISSYEAHHDEDINGSCDVCGWDMPLSLEENISFVFDRDGNKVLRIEGGKPSGAETVKLRYYDKDKPENGDFIENLAILETSYIFEINYDKLTYTDDYSPIYVFDLYSYSTKNNNPQITKIKNNNYLENTYYKNSVSGKTYWNVTTLDDEDDRLAIQPEAVHAFSVINIILEEKENNLYMYVSAIGPKETMCVKLRANLSGNIFFIDDTSEYLGKFEFCVNLSNFDIGDVYFCFYEYYDKEPNNLDVYSSTYILFNNSKLRSGESVIVGDKQYTVNVSTNDNVSIKIATPDFTITKISLKIVDSKPCLLISAIAPSVLSSEDVIIKASPYAAASYENKEIKSSTTTSGKFEFCLDLSAFRDYDMWWVNIYYGVSGTNEKGDENYNLTNINPSSLMSEEEIVLDGYKYSNHSDDGDVGNTLRIYISKISE